MTKDSAGQRASSGRPSLRRIESPYRLTAVELDFIELVAKGFGPMDASRSLGIRAVRGEQMLRDLVSKLEARDPEHFRQLAIEITCSRRSERFVVLD
jgi:hypothetical protein